MLEPKSHDIEWVPKPKPERNWWEDRGFLDKRISELGHDPQRVWEFMDKCGPYPSFSRFGAFVSGSTDEYMCPSCGRPVKNTNA